MKIVKKALIAVVVLVSSIMGLCQMNKKEVSYPEFTLRNVEALANQELIGSLIQLTGSGWVCFEEIRDDMYYEFFLCTDCDGCINTTASYVNNSNYCL